MKNVIMEYGQAALAAFGGILIMGTLGALFLSQQGLIVQMVAAWGNGGVG